MNGKNEGSTGHVLGIRCARCRAFAAHKTSSPLGRRADVAHSALGYGRRTSSAGRRAAAHMRTQMLALACTGASLTRSRRRRIRIRCAPQRSPPNPKSRDRPDRVGIVASGIMQGACLGRLLLVRTIDMACCSAAQGASARGRIELYLMASCGERRRRRGMQRWARNLQMESQDGQASPPARLFLIPQAQP